MDFKAIADKKVGGIPIVAAAGIVTAATVYFVWQQKKTGSTAATSPDVLATTGDTTASQPVFSALPAPVLTSTGEAPTNDTWTKSAVQWLMTQQSMSAGEAQAVVNGYLQGGDLTYEQGLQRDAVVKALGLPPDLPSTGTTAGSANATKQGNPPTTHVVRGNTDNTIAALARLYYGSGDDLYLEDISAANQGSAVGTMSPTATIAVGTRVTIPVASSPAYFRATLARRTLWQIAPANSLTQDRLYALNMLGNGGNRFGARGSNTVLPVGTNVRVK